MSNKVNKSPWRVLYFVTSNDGKYDDVSWYVNRYEPAIQLQQVKVELQEIQTSDHRQIAIEKAKYAWNIIKKPLIVDDSGIYFDRYDNFPGPFLKFVYYGLGLNGMLKLLEGDNRATFRWYIVCAYGPNDFEVFEGKCEGILITPNHLEVRWPHLRVADIFIPTDMHKSPFKEKTKVDYQYRAIKKFFRWLYNKDKTDFCQL